MKEKEDLGIIDQRRLKRRDNIIQYVIPNWILKQKYDIREKNWQNWNTGYSLVKSVEQHQFPGFYHCAKIMEDGDIGKAW